MKTLRRGGNESDRFLQEQCLRQQYLKGSDPEVSVCLAHPRGRPERLDVSGWVLEAAVRVMTFYLNEMGRVWGRGAT